MIRSRLFDLTREPNKQLNAQNALALSKIARIDFPLEWPTMAQELESLIEQASSSNNLVQLSNLLAAANQLVKHLSLIRFGAARKAFYECAPSLLKLVGKVYLAVTETWMTRENKSLDSSSIALMEVGYIALKVVGKVMSEGFTNIHRNEDGTELFTRLVDHFQGFIMVYDANSDSDLISKYIKALGKIFSHLFERQPVPFILLPRSLEVVHIYVSLMEKKAAIIQNVGNDNDDDEIPEDLAEFWEKTVVQGLQLFKSMLGLFHKNGVTTIRYRTTDDKEETRRACEILKTQLFTEQNIMGLMNLLLTSYLRLTPRDLSSWKTEPEEWVVEELKKNWEYQARTCSEKVFTDIFVNFKEMVTPVLMSFIENASSSEDVLIKDVAYNAFSLASCSPFENINFNDMMKNLFLPQGYSSAEVNGVPDERYKLVRRRVCMIISDWVPIQCDEETKVLIYKFLLFCLNPEDPLNDKVIKLYACEALRYTVDEWNTKIENFLPFLSSFLSLMFPLLTSELSSVESKQFVLQIVSVIIDRVQRNIAPYSELILKALPPLWEESQEHYQMKGIILQTLSNFIAASGENSTMTYSMAVPILKMTVDPQSPYFTYLYEDALPLWQSLVENCPSSTPENPNSESINEILSMLPLLITLIKERSESLSLQLKILESYTLLSPVAVAEQSFELFRTFQKYLKYLNIETMTWVTTILGLIVLQLPIENYVRSLYESGLLKELIVVLQAEVSPIINVQILNVFSRICINHSSAFVEVLDMTTTPTSQEIMDIKHAHNSGSERGIDEEESNNNGGSGSRQNFNNTLELVIYQMVSKFDNMGHPRDRKLNALGVAALLKTGRINEIQGFLGDIFVMWDQVIEEANETDVGDCEIYYSYEEYTNPNQSLVRTSQGRALYDGNSTASGDASVNHQEILNEIQQSELEMSPEMKRRRNLSDIDPVHSVALKPFLSQALVYWGKISPQHEASLRNVDSKILSTTMITLGLS